MSAVLILSRRLLVSALMIALIVPSVPLWAASRATSSAAAQTDGTIAGTARLPTGEVLPNITVQLRNIQTGQVIVNTTSASDGTFGFAGLAPGSYVVELVNAAGNVVGTTAAIVLTAPSMVANGLTVFAAAASRAAAAGFFTSTLGIVTIAAIGAGVVGLTVASRPDASPSR